MGPLVRNVEVQPAFEKRHDDPSRDYGIGCAMMRFTLSGPDGGVSFRVFTGWYLPHVVRRLRKETQHELSPITGEWRRCSLEGHGGEMHTHYPPDRAPSYLKDQEPMDCDLVEGGKCIGDVGFTIGDTLFTALVEGGTDKLWAELEEIYNGLQEEASQ